MKKKVLLVAIILALIFTVVACKPPQPENGTTYKYPNVLPDLVDYSVNAMHHSPNRVAYNETERAKAEADLQIKIDTETPKITADTSSFTRIFCASDPVDVVANMSAAALPQDKMIALVDYLTRNDESGAIQQYEKHDDLEDAYDNATGTAKDDAYDELQRHRRKIMTSVFTIFKNDGDQFARVAVKELIYANVIIGKMKDSGSKYYYEGQKPIKDITSTDDYVKFVLEDYETLSYLKSFNQTVSVAEKDMIKLYGYYYHYEKKGYDTLSEADFEKQLVYRRKTTMTNDEALDYTRIRRINYEGAYRYSVEFYQKFYTAHFAFQAKQEAHDINVYGIGANELDKTKTYSSEMLEGMSLGMASQLKMSDINHIYTGVNDNVTKYNQLNNTYEQNTKNQLNEVLLNVHQLNVQYYTMTFVDTQNPARSTTNSDLVNALKYQIKAYSGDNIRMYQSYKKEQIVIGDEIKKLEQSGASTTEKEDELGRSKAMMANIPSNYSDAGVAGQMTNASSVAWDSVKKELKETIDEDYTKVQKNVKKYFENKIIKKICKVAAHEEERKLNEYHSVDCEQAEYDENHNISKLLMNHEEVIYYANGTVRVRFTQISSVNALSGVDVPELNKAYYFSELSSRPQMTTFKTISGETDENFDRNIIENTMEKPGTFGKVLNNGSCEVERTIDSTIFIFTYTFEGVWYIDKEYKYPALQGETYDFDIKLYPGYIVSKRVKA